MSDSDAPILPEVGTSVPATAITIQGVGSASQIVIGSTRFQSPFPNESSGFMFAVVDLSDLSIVAKAAPVSNTTVPAEIQPYAGKEGFFLFCVAANNRLNQVPQGDLYTFLMSTGAGAMLENLEQIATQIGTGSLGAYTYILAGTLDSNDLPGFEAMSITDTSVLAMQFVPITVNGQTMYSPTRYSTP